MNLFLPELWDQQEPIELIQRQQQINPVVWCEDSIKGPHWSVLSDEHVRLVELDHETFSAEGITIYTDQDSMIPAMVAMDPPEHTVRRKAINGFFSSDSMRELSSLIRKNTIEVLESLPVNTEFDWVSVVANELPYRVLCYLLDYPYEEKEQMIKWERSVMPPTELIQGRCKKSPKVISDEEWHSLNEERFTLQTECLFYFDAIRQERLKNPKDDFITKLAEVSEDAGEFYGNILLLLTGSVDSLRASMTGAVYMLDKNNIQLTPDTIENAVHETIRLQSPIRYMAREATRDTELSGNKIKKGDLLYLWFTAANRDASVYANPNSFDLQRENSSKHLAFGHGVHKCIGYRLGQLELKILLEELSKRYKVKVLSEPRRVHSFVEGAYENLQVSLETL